MEPGEFLETSRSTLELEADSTIFLDTKLRLRCEAWLYKLYRQTSEELELCEDTPQLASVLGPSIAGKVISCHKRRPRVRDDAVAITGSCRIDVCQLKHF